MTFQYMSNMFALVCQSKKQSDKCRSEQPLVCCVCSKLLMKMTRGKRVGLQKKTPLVCSSSCEHNCAHTVGFVQGFLLSYVVCHVLHRWMNNLTEVVPADKQSVNEDTVQTHVCNTDKGLHQKLFSDTDSASDNAQKTEHSVDHLISESYSPEYNVSIKHDSVYISYDQLSVSHHDPDSDEDLGSDSILSQNRVEHTCLSTRSEKLSPDNKTHAFSVFKEKHSSTGVSCPRDRQENESLPGICKVTSGNLQPFEAWEEETKRKSKRKKRPKFWTQAKMQKMCDSKMHLSKAELKQPSKDTTDVDEHCCQLGHSSNGQHTTSTTTTMECEIEQLEERSSHLMPAKVRETQKGTLKCPFCEKKFQTGAYLKKHLQRLHSGEDRKVCEQCGSQFVSAAALRSHQYNCHRFSHICHICGVKFTIRSSFKKHLTAHEGVQRHFCDVCGAGFVHKTSFNKHKFVHVSEKLVQCDICSKLFKTQFMLNQHLLVMHQCGPCFESRLRGLAKMGASVDAEAVTRHTNHLCALCGEQMVNNKCPSHPEEVQSVFKCVQCVQNFDDIVSYYKHVKLHKGLSSHGSMRNGRTKQKKISDRKGDQQKPNIDSLFVCCVCSKTFKKKHYLSMHMYQHKTERFSCEFCEKRFTYKSNLKSHLASIHSDSRDFVCDICDKAFKHKFALKCHARLHGDSEFTCGLCEKPFTRKQNLQKHYINMHPDYLPKNKL